MSRDEKSDSANLIICRCVSVGLCCLRPAQKSHQIITSALNFKQVKVTTLLYQRSQIKKKPEKQHKCDTKVSLKIAGGILDFLGAFLEKLTHIYFILFNARRDYF